MKTLFWVYVALLVLIIGFGIFAGVKSNGRMCDDTKVCNIK